MIRNITVGIDVGSSTTRVVVGEFIKGEKFPRILGVGESASLGIRHGCIVSFTETANSIKKAISQAEKISNIKIKRAFLGVNNVSLKGESALGSAIISKADGEVTNLDIDKAIEDARKTLTLNNKKILQAIPISYKLDGSEITGKIEGLKGNKIEIKVLFITCSSQHIESLVDALAEAGIEPVDVVPLCVNTGNEVLSKRHKMVGSAIANIGSETTSIATFENDTLTSLQVFQLGSSDITNDIALGFKTNLEEAEKLKLNQIEEKSSKKKVEEITEARLEDIFDLIKKHLKKIGRDELLPAGIIFVGGGANTHNLEELSKKYLSLPSKIGQLEMFINAKTKLKDPVWLPVVCLLFTSGENPNQNYNNDKNGDFLAKIKTSIKNTLKQLMP